MALDYSTAFANLTAGNFSGAIIQTYETPLGSFAWIAAVFATLMMVYIKTQDAGVTSIVAILWLFFARFYLGVVGDLFFTAVLILGICVVLVRFWGR